LEDEGGGEMDMLEFDGGVAGVETLSRLSTGVIVNIVDLKVVGRV
jgi:hypothetical protein